MAGEEVTCDEGVRLLLSMLLLDNCLYFPYVIDS
jgi:hypothetical protein